VGTSDGTYACLYVDGALEAAKSVTGPLCVALPVAFNIGAYDGDAARPMSAPLYGRVDEAFVTGDVLTEDQVRNLYCASIPHSLGAIPKRASVSVRRRRKGAAASPADFTTPPLRLHNLSGGSLGDEGSQNVPLVANGYGSGAWLVAGADGSAKNAIAFVGAHSLTAADTGLPAGLTTRSYGVWAKTTNVVNQVLMYWGASGTTMCQLWINTSGEIVSSNGNDGITAGYIRDGQWHHVVVVEDNAAADGVRRKLYMDGLLIGASTVMYSVTTLGANGFVVGAVSVGGSTGLIGEIDSAFVCGHALTSADIVKLYTKGAQELGISPKNSGDHIEQMNATSLLALFDSLEMQHAIDLTVAP